MVILKKYIKHDYFLKKIGYCYVGRRGYIGIEENKIQTNSEKIDRKIKLITLYIIYLLKIYINIYSFKVI